jgi:hypothetical protein
MNWASTFNHGGLNFKLTLEELHICRKGGKTILFSPPDQIYIFQMKLAWEGIKGRVRINGT